MIRFIYGKSGSGKTERIFSEMERSENRVFLLVPDREAVAAESRTAEWAGAWDTERCRFGGSDPSKRAAPAPAPKTPPPAPGWRY